MRNVQREQISPSRGKTFEEKERKGVEMRGAAAFKTLAIR